jgi:hypothetical protein
MSHPLQCGKAVLKRPALSNPGVCMLFSRPTEACKNAVLVLYAKHHVHLSKAVLTLNLLGKETCEDSSEIFHIGIRCCPGTQYGVEAHFIARHFLSLARHSFQQIQICKLVLFDLGTSD